MCYLVTKIVTLTSNSAEKIHRKTKGNMYQRSRGECDQLFPQSASARLGYARPLGRAAVWNLTERGA